METFAPPAALNSAWTPSKVLSTGRVVRVVHSPLVLRFESNASAVAPPRLSVPRNVEADAQAVCTRSAAVGQKR